MPELPVIQNLNPAVFKTTTSAEMRFRRPAFRGTSFHSPEQGFDPHRPYQPSFFQTITWRFVEAAEGGNKSLKGGTNGSEVRILAVLYERRSLDIRYTSERGQCIPSFPRTAAGPRSEGGEESAVSRRL